MVDTYLQHKTTLPMTQVNNYRMSTNEQMASKGKEEK